MRILSANQIREVEEKAFQKYFSEEELMYRAGEACFSKIMKTYGNEMENAKVAVVCGNGKNAGDGFVIAKMLFENNVNAFIALADRAPKLSEPKKFFDEAMSAGVQVFDFDQADFNVRFIVDCIFGIGFHGEVKAPFDEVFDTVNNSGATVIAIDTPSGTDATNGTVTKAIKADLTIAISTLKYAHVLPPANEYCKKTVTVNIGIPEDCYDEDYDETIVKSEVKRSFPITLHNANKGSLGHQLNICGSYKMPGAAVISAKGALRSGVGLLKCLFPKSIYPVMTTHLTQPVFAPLTENEEKTISMGALTSILGELTWADSVVIGCGIGVNDDTQVIVNQVIRECKKPLVIDADGINCLNFSIDILQDKNAPVILTPHPGEMARLTQKTVDEVQKNRISTAKKFAKKHNVILVLKGANTVVTDGKRVKINTTGNPGMAMGGTGDLLSGMLGAFLAQGMEPFDAACAGVYIHGLCGDITARELSKRSMTVDDMAELLGVLMSEFE